VVANDLRCSKYTHDRHKCVWNGEVRVIIEGEVEIQKRLRRIPMQSVKVVKLLSEEEIWFVRVC
jgi:hypothetical protein